VLLAGCGESQQSAPAPEAKPEPPTTEAPDYDIWLSATLGNIEAVKQHLAAGTDVNAKGRDGWTPLHNAARNGHKEIVELLIDNGADVNAKHILGETPLHLVNSHRKPKEIIELLVAKGADVNAMFRLHELDPIDAAETLLDQHIDTNLADHIRKHGGKTGAELKAEGK
jgi:ankyrin repeat protein